MTVSATIELDGGLTLSYAEQGATTAPAVLFLPGPTDAWRSYVPVLEHLPPSIRAVAVSQRGHGDSDKPATGYRIDDFASDVPRLLDALDIEHAVLVAHSGSCLTARLMAIDHTRRVAGLVLEASPFTLRGDPGLTEFVETRISELTDPIDPDFARDLITRTASDALTPALVEQLVADLERVPVHVWREMFGGLLEHDDTEQLERIDAPTLLIWGDADELVPRDAQNDLVERLPSAELVVYPGVGHTPRWERPERFATDVARFADRVSG